jgi:glycosyltransferase involved in cell wall biosynthesis
MTKVTIIVPCFNEEGNIKECIKRISKLNQDYEILVVDDGSNDRTTEAAKSIKQNNVKVIRYEKNRGKGHAIKTGLDNSAGEIVVIQDADMATPPEELPDIVKPIIDGKADFVNGSRLMYPMENGAMKSMHVFGNRIFAVVVSLMIRKWLTDTLCGFKAFRRDALKGKLNEDSWPDFELIFLAKKEGMKIAEVPIHYKKRTAGKSKMRTVNHTLKMLRMLARALPDLASF